MSEEVKSEEKEAVRKQRSYIPKDLLVKCKQDYLEGKGSIRELAELYNVSYNALAARCSRDNWRCDSDKVVKKVFETVEKYETSRLERLHSHEEEMISRMKKRLLTVDKAFSQIGELVEPQDLKSLVGTEATIDQVIRRNLGAEEKVNVSGSIDVNVVAILEKLRGMERKPLDVEAEEIELSSCKLVEG